MMNIVSNRCILSTRGGAGLTDGGRHAGQVAAAYDKPGCSGKRPDVEQKASHRWHQQVIVTHVQSAGRNTRAAGSSNSG